MAWPGSSALPHLQSDHAEQRRPQLAVGKELAVESSAVLGPGVEHVEELEQHESGEGSVKA